MKQEFEIEANEEKSPALLANEELMQIILEEFEKVKQERIDRIIEELIDDINGRQGGIADFDVFDEELQDEIKETWSEIINRNFP